MSRLTLFSAPFVLGFDTVEERFDRLAKSADAYPPYNIERLRDADGDEKYVISIAVAGFAQEDLEVTTEDNQLLVRGRNTDTTERHFLHRGIATRQFQRSFLLADGTLVEGAEMRDGLLIITLKRPNIEKPAKRIDIKVNE